MSTISKHKGFTLLEIIISLAIAISLLLVIIKINSDLFGDYYQYSEEGILEDDFDNAMLNLDNMINGYLVSEIRAENNKIIIKYDLDFEKNYYKVKSIYLNNNKLMVATNSYDSTGVSTGQNVIMNNVKEFNVYLKGALIYFEIVTESGESRIRCI